MVETEAWTIGRLLTWTTEFLRKHGADSPRLDAEVLLAHVRSCQRIALYTTFEELPDEAQRKTFRELVRKRSEGAPVAYLVGYKEFYSLRFRVTPDVLIPRPETETLVLATLDAIKQRPAAQVIDVGTGSGAIAITLAKQAPRCHVTAIDVSPPALAIAAENARQHALDSRIDFQLGDLLAPISAEPKFDAIVSNPPYVSDAEMRELPRDVRDFEPHLALQAGPRGTEVIARLIPQAADRLVAGGSLLLEISPMIHKGVCELLAADGRFAETALIKDSAGAVRVAHARRLD